MPKPIKDRIAAAIVVDAESACWLWQRSLSDGYGRMQIGNRKRPAHVVSFETFVGAIPLGHEIDHLCRTRHCVNPVHLEAVTHRENVLRGSAPPAQQAKQHRCKRGHSLLDDANVYRPHGGARRVCRACNCIHSRSYTARKKEGQKCQ